MAWGMLFSSLHHQNHDFLLAVVSATFNLIINILNLKTNIHELKDTKLISIKLNFISFFLIILMLNFIFNNMNNISYLNCQAITCFLLWGKKKASHFNNYLNKLSIWTIRQRLLIKYISVSTKIWNNTTL